MTIKECNYPVVDNIIRIISEKGLKQKSVAIKAGQTPKDFNSMLMGRKIIKVCDVLPIADALSVRVEELYKKGVVK